MDIENKAEAGVFDPVTAADKAAERVIRRELRARHPDHGVLGEEYGATHRASPMTLGDRPDRRHQSLHHRRADLGHADRPSDGEGRACSG